MFREKLLWICSVFVVVIVAVSSDRYYVTNKGCNTCSKRGPPFCKQWCIITVSVGCCLQSRYTCCSYREKLGVCPVSRQSCFRPYPYYSTRMYECEHDFNCPLGYKCCSDCCFTHKICKKSKTKKPIPLPWPKPSIPTTTVATTTTTTSSPTTPEVITELPSQPSVVITETPTTIVTTSLPTTTTEFIIEVPEIVEPSIIVEPVLPTTLPNLTIIEGSGYGNNDLEEPNAAFVGELTDDEDFQH